MVISTKGRSREARVLTGASLGRLDLSGSPSHGIFTPRAPLLSLQSMAVLEYREDQQHQEPKVYFSLTSF
ncbi:hypothetical protein E2C01_033067 [Portunus trituberculatus]|uniref:Uncharacterized protein n=1 Tax=Portunus trituberculatus TaxID=210409 RepID=A0A5B7F2S1_PORTR|nr:hypothetical protein [Portunus trituberculatus]